MPSTSLDTLVYNKLLFNAMRTKHVQLVSHNFEQRNDSAQTAHASKSLMKRTFLLTAIILIVNVLFSFTNAEKPTDEAWRAGIEVSESKAATMIGTEAFVATGIPSSVRERMKGKSYPADGKAQIGLDNLRYLRLLHYTIDGKIKTGEMVVNKAIADDVVEIFLELFKNKYPIERIQLIDDFDANDEQSMRANNSSAFCYRVVSGSKRLSKHALGLAIDLNPLYNPYFKILRNKNGERVGYKNLQPTTATPYVNRGSNFPYKMTSNDLAVRLFKAKGFTWGGDWRSRKDYQHFEK